MSVESTIGAMTGILPVVVTAGVAMKMVDWMGSGKPSVLPLVNTKKPARKKDVYNRGYSGSFGNFSNIGR